ncbi:MAG: polysaccharide biosynthesis C-terminal domain-containing protein [Spirochaetia bacterium]|nr:polysaccharide biosynthesis C-terminal domain-containing protein [Spirochaetia bacterium]
MISRKIFFFSKSIMLYGIAAGLNKGISILYIPFLTKFLTLSQVGIFSIIQTIAQILSAVLSMNGASAIIREGANDDIKAIELLNRFLLNTLILCSVFIPIVYFFDGTEPKEYFIASILTLSEAAHLLLLSWLRVKDKVNHYLIFVSLKSLGILVFFLIVLYNHMPFIYIFVVQILWNLTLSFFYIFIIHSKAKYRGIFKWDTAFNSILAYSFFLIPHNIAQWIMSGSDKILIKYIIDNKSVGMYTISYTLCLLLMLLNSGLAIGLPVFIIKNYKSWISKKNRLIFLIFYSIASIIIYILIYFILYIDKNYFVFIKFYDKIIYDLIIWIFSGIYFLGSYYIYANIIFYHRKTKVISAITLFSAIFNIVLSFYLIYEYGIKGAAIGTFFTYLIYYLLTFFFATRLENEIKIENVYQELLVHCITILIFFNGYHILGKYI